MRALTLSLVALAALLAADVWAQESDQLYLVGFEAPLGSISSAGQSQTAVYLRWDTLEGELPSDLVEFELFRGATSLGLFPANATLSDVEIGVLYAGPENERRLFEMLRWLNEEDPDTSPIMSNDFPAELRTRVLDVPPRAWLGSRIDFNVAVARYRGYRDVGLAPGSYTYELRGAFSGAENRRLGQVTVTVADTPDLAPSAQSFAQVTIGRCDAPERGKDHYSVALNWQTAGASVPDRYANALAIAGYDLYRTTDSEPGVPVRDLRAEAVLGGYDSGGNVSLAGLEKINDQPIVIAGSAAQVDQYAGFNPAFAQFVETQDVLMAAGLAPGDQRAYYLVARDQSGNWGETVGLNVSVPDTEPPAAPWAIRGFPSQANGYFRLIWPEVSPRSYYERNRSGRTYCNLEDARLEAGLEFVMNDETCESTVPRRIDLAVAEYVVYRFENDRTGANFTDADGDGFDDADERSAITDPGTACNPMLPDPITTLLTRYRVGTVPASDAVVGPDGIVLLHFDDPVPAQNIGQQYYYRVASRDIDGNTSAMSMLVPGVVPDRSLPDRDTEFGGLNFGRRRCMFVATLESFAANEVGVDYSSSESAHTLRLSCEDPAPEAAPGVLLPIEELPSVRAAVLSNSQCPIVMDLDGGCAGKDLTYDYLNRSGEVLASVTQSSAPDDCPVVASRLDELCDVPTYLPIGPGEVVPPEEGPYLDPLPTLCMGVFRDIGEESFRITTLCPGDPTFNFAPLADLGSDLICIEVVAYSVNAVGSNQLRLPCFRRPGRPHPPTPVALDFAALSSDGTISLLHADRPAEGALIEWQKKGDPSSRHVRYVTRPAGPDTDTPQSTVIDVGPEPPGDSWQQEWCFRALSVGGLLFGDPHTGFSDWSDPVCTFRRSGGLGLIESLPWPQIASPEAFLPLAARFLVPDDIPMVLLSNDLTQTGCTPFNVTSCDPTLAGAACTGDSAIAFCTMCAAFHAVLTVPPSFVAYRQHRPAGSAEDPSDFFQVSPLVKAHCVHDSVSDPIDILDDPFISMLNIPGVDPWPGYRLVFTDRTPYRDGQELRYQLVFFRGGEIIGFATSNWMAP